jgi:guanylate kinase
MSGPSGVGKGTIRGELLKKIPTLFMSISATTRSPREGEREAADYFFMAEATFLDMIAKDQFLEYAKVYSNYYGTPMAFVADNLRQGRDVLLEIDIQGALKVREKMPEAIFIFIYPPSIEELSQRLFLRGKDSSVTIAERLAASEEEMTYIDKYDYAVKNDWLETAVDKVRAIIVAEGCKVNKGVN